MTYSLATLHEAKEKFEATAEEQFKLLTKKLFEEVPELEALRWNQYTPIFNDGDVCEFTVEELHFILRDNIVDESEDDDCEDYVCETRYDIENNINIPKASRTACIKFDRDVFNDSVFQSCLENLFGEPKTIQIKRNGKVELEDYDGYY